MSPSLVTSNLAAYACLRCVVAAIVSVIPVASTVTSEADGQEHSLVVRIDARNAGLPSGEIALRIGNISVPVMALKTSPDVRRNIAIVIDAGPDQAQVLPREKELAVALVDDLSDARTSFTVARAGVSSKTQATTDDRFVAIEHIRDIAGEIGEKTKVPIYDAIGSAIRQISLSPGLRVLIFIGEGNDGGSRMRYAELRGLAESNQVAFFAALIADHTPRGARSILRYGWNLQDLTSDTAGIFLENPSTQKATRHLSENIRNLILISFDTRSLRSGRHKVVVLAHGNKRLRAQRVVIIP